MAHVVYLGIATSCYWLRCRKHSRPLYIIATTTSPRLFVFLLSCGGVEAMPYGWFFDFFIAIAAREQDESTCRTSTICVMRLFFAKETEPPSQKNIPRTQMLWQTSRNRREQVLGPSKFQTSTFRELNGLGKLSPGAHGRLAHGLASDLPKRAWAMILNRFKNSSVLSRRICGGF